MRPTSTSGLRNLPVALSRRAFTSTIRASAGAPPQNVVQSLEERGLVASLTSRALRSHVNEPRTVYCGVDPSADSLHLGNLVALIGLLHFQLHGHHILPLMGGATGSVGDPSGRASERQALPRSVLEHNMRSITSQLSLFYERGLHFASQRSRISHPPGRLQVVNNLDWLGSLSLLDFLSGPGKRARVSSMLARESIKTRLNSPSGISFTEFAYNLLQAYDFQHLHQHYNCSIQLGGSDQYGNIMAGIEMMHREGLLSGPAAQTQEPESQAESTHAFGLTFPLLTTSSGAKFGKSAGNAVWLDPHKTSPFELYQFMLQVNDADVERYLKIFTFLPLSELEQISTEHRREPRKRLAQTTLASEVTELIHGTSGVTQAKRATDLLFGQGRLSAAEAQACLPSSMVVEAAMDQVSSATATDLAVLAGLALSKSKARQLIKAGGLYINGAQAYSPEQHADLTDNGTVVLRGGKNQYKVIVVQ